MAAKSIYKSCNCRGCRRTDGWRSSKEWFKRKIHRRFRRLEREAVRCSKEIPAFVSGGFRA